jgi:GcrA cell cycle regulator
MAWTEDMIAKLRELWEAGAPASTIAEQLGEGLSRNAVIGKAHRLGLAARPSPVKTADSAASAPAARPASQPKRAAPKAARTTLLDLNDRVCKWPIGHPNEADFHFCGKPVSPGFPYCPEHCALAYQAQMPRKDRPAGAPPPFRSPFRPR